ncbi:MAG: protein phosphatase 2C domain-containing protein [Acidobacteriota bacterium]
MENGTVICNVAARSDVGVVRSNNEDNLIMADLMTGESLPENFQLNHRVGENTLLLAVSDGVGGALYGEVASELTVFALKDALMRLSRSVSASDRLVAAVEEANNIVWNERRTNPIMQNMAATVTAALIEDNQVFVAVVGDSRAYLVRDGKIKQITTDQSLVAQLVARGALKPENADHHPQRNMILQAIGGSEAIQVAVNMFQLSQQDVLLLCTDGLSNMVNTDEMRYLVENLSPTAACDQLISLAKQRGAPDNVTVILAKFGGDGLNTHIPANGLTSYLATLSTYDPEQESRKSHKRTTLLGGASISDRYYGTTGDLPAIQKVDSLAAFPNSALLKQECQRLQEYLDYCQHMLTVKGNQFEQAAQWLEEQGTHYANLPEALAQIESGLEHLKEVQRTAAYLLQALEKNEPVKS